MKELHELPSLGVGGQERSGRMESDRPEPKPSKAERKASKASLVGPKWYDGVHPLDDHRVDVGEDIEEDLGSCKVCRGSEARAHAQE